MAAGEVVANACEIVTNDGKNVTETHTTTVAKMLRPKTKTINGVSAGKGIVCETKANGNTARPSVGRRLKITASSNAAANPHSNPINANGKVSLYASNRRDRDSAARGSVVRYFTIAKGDFATTGDMSKMLNTNAHRPKTTPAETTPPPKRFHHGPLASPIGIDVWTVADIDDRERRAPMKANNMYAEAATAVATKPMLHSRDGFA
jgi:hypothetical protein